MHNIGMDFYTIVNNLGEDVSFNVSRDDTMPMFQTVKASLENATQAAYNMVDRAYLVKGNMVIPNSKSTQELKGLYFTRESVPDKNYLMISALPEPQAPLICFVYAVECNAEASLLKKNDNTGEKDEWGNPISTYRVENENIPVYWYTTLRSYKIQNNGRLDQAIYTMYLPAKYKLSPADKVIKKSFVNGVYKDEIYNVDSIETAMSSLNESGEIIGIVSAQLTLNLDKVVVEDEEP